MNHEPHGKAQTTHDGKFPTSPSIDEQQSALFQTALEKMNRDAGISQRQSKDKLTSLFPASATLGLGGSAYVATIGEQLEVFHVVFAKEFIHGKDAYIKGSTLCGISEIKSSPLRERLPIRHVNCQRCRMAIENLVLLSRFVHGAQAAVLSN